MSGNADDRRARAEVVIDRSASMRAGNDTSGHRKPPAALSAAFRGAMLDAGLPVTDESGQPVWPGQGQDHHHRRELEARSAEQIIRAGDLRQCRVRELLDIAREMGVPVHDHRKPAVLKAIEAEARLRGWLRSAWSPARREGGDTDGD